MIQSGADIGEDLYTLYPRTKIEKRDLLAAYIFPERRENVMNEVYRPLFYRPLSPLRRYSQKAIVVMTLFRLFN